MVKKGSKKGQKRGFLALFLLQDQGGQK